MMTWDESQEKIEEELVRLFLRIKNRPKGQPYDATEHEGDIGELMFRGLIEPCVSRSTADVSVDGGRLLFSLTGAGHAAKKP